MRQCALECAREIGGMVIVSNVTSLAAMISISRRALRFRTDKPDSGAMPFALDLAGNGLHGESARQDLIQCSARSAATPRRPCAG